MARKRTQTTKAVSKAVEQAVAKAAPVAEAVEKKAVSVAETAEKKAAAKKPVKKAEIKTNLSVQYMGKDISGKDMVALVKKDWTAKKNKIGDIKTMDLYVKVEENKVYYVINGEMTGSVEI